MPRQRIRMKGKPGRENAIYDKLTGGAKVTTRPATPFLMPFGEHEGKPLVEVPTNYLQWFVGLRTLCPGTRLIVETYLLAIGVAIPARKERGKRGGRRRSRRSVG